MKSLSQSLSKWYLENRRELPWRSGKDPYRIWISEVMLQQTTVQAVVPYFEKFVEKFPSLKVLAGSALAEVLEAWAGLGYYSRARNLHKSAQALALRDFPKTAAELLSFPGFGPYTSRAVTSIAFGEKVGVLDGNVIRVLSRAFGLKLEWWSNRGRQILQNLSDQLAQEGDPSVINQALMELGATVCTARSPSCLLCPWRQDCASVKNDQISELPLKKPRRESEIWVWKPKLFQKRGKYAVIENDYAPFLKKQWIFPGSIKKQNKKPKIFDLKHGITHHNIFVLIESSKKSTMKTRGVKWVTANELKKLNPSSVLQKIITHS
jgi:A/G-specific adenine glycosylase